MHFIGFYNYTVVLTYASLLSAFLGMTFASRGNFGAAILCLIGCGICDAFDGMVARSKKNRTEDEKSFGIQLDSLCDVVSFGVFPAYVCYHMGMNGVLGWIILCAYCICAVARLAFFNVLETKRQQVEGGSNKFYRGMPVTTISMLFPLIFLLNYVLPQNVFVIILYVMLAAVAFLFVLDVKVKKPDISKLFKRK